MNKQAKYKDGQLVGRGIEWTDYTWNPVGGCLHECHWTMPDGSVARCYAKDVALGVAQKMYPHGFEAHYFHPERLQEPLNIKAPAKIFIDSMADLMGHWVPKEEIEDVLGICKKANWHTFQLLTKNPKRLLSFDPFPANIWPGFSSPPDFLMGQQLSDRQKQQKLTVDLQAMKALEASVKWCSIEPLSWDVAGQFENCGLNWVVIGAASNGVTKYQPDSNHLERLLGVLDKQGIPVFFKGNLKTSPWREVFPQVEAIR